VFCIPLVSESRPNTDTYTHRTMEIFTRLGLALVLSLGLAVLMAWGWDSAEPLPAAAPQVAEAKPTATR
jgi:hypothetical protein